MKKRYQNTWFCWLFTITMIISNRCRKQHSCLLYTSTGTRCKKTGQQGPPFEIWREPATRRKIRLQIYGHLWGTEVCLLMEVSTHRQNPCREAGGYFTPRENQADTERPWRRDRHHRQENDGLPALCQVHPAAGKCEAGNPKEPPAANETFRRR